MADPLAPQPAPTSTTRISPMAVIRRVAFLAVSAAVLYLLLPGLIAVFGTFDQVQSLGLGWFVAMIAAESASFFLISLLTRLLLPGTSLFGITCAQLAGHALSTVIPGGAATGGAVQYRMLVKAGADPAEVGSAMTVQGIVLTAAVFTLPVFALPAIVFGLGAPPGLLNTAYVGFAVFALLLGFGAALMISDTPVRIVATVIAKVACRFRRGVDPVELARRLIRERNQVRERLGRKWLQALVYSIGKWLLEYVVLLLALEAVGVQARPSLVLLAYTASAVLSMIPITPGGLGFVEAGLTGTLALAGVGGAPAAVATLAYRLITYWLPLPAGLIAWILYRRHYGRPDDVVASTGTGRGKPHPSASVPS